MYIESLYNFIFQYSFVLPVLIALFFYKKIRSEAVCTIIVFYCIIFFLLNFYFESFPKTTSSRKIYYFSYTFFEYLTFASIFWLKIQNKIFKRFVLLSSLFFVGFQI